MTTALSTHDLSFGYGRRVVGSGVSIAVRAGEVVALLGPNGGGKTTLFRTMLGLLRPLAGQVRIDETSIEHLSRAAIAQRVAYVPQAHAGYFPFTVIHVVTMGRTAHLSPFASPSRHDRELAWEALTRVGVERLGDAVYTRISGGERQLVLIARALAQGAPLIIMDEPTASLDFGNRVRVMDEIERLRAAGSGILLSTHDPDQALRGADRVAMLHDGRLLAEGPSADTISAENLRTVYGIDVDIAAVAGPDGRLVNVCVPSRARSG